MRNLTLVILALLMAAMVPSAVFARGGGQSQNRGGGRNGGYHQSVDRGGQSDHRHGGGGDRLFWTVAGLIIGAVVNQPAPAQPAPQPAPVVVQPAAPVTQNTTVVINDGAVTVPKPAGITGPVVLQPWGMNITVPASKPIAVGSQIWFLRGDQVIGKYAVKAIDGQTATVAYLAGDKPKAGDGFYIPPPN
jgi:hypothetical protein